MRRNERTRNRKKACLAASATLVLILGGETCWDETSFSGRATAQTRGLPFRPIGSPSEVDRFRGETSDPNSSASGSSTNPFSQAVYSNRNPYAEATGGNIRQVAMQSGGFNLPTDSGAAYPPATNPTAGNGSAVVVPTAPGFSPPNNFSPPPVSTPPQLPPRTSPPAAAPPASSPAVSQVAPRTLPVQPNAMPAQPSALPLQPNGDTFRQSGVSDYQPIAPPQLANGGFATMNDCRLITPPSSYTAMSPYGCGEVAPASYAPTTYAPTTYTAPPIGVAPPQSVVAPLVNPAPLGSLVSFGQERYPVQVGPGLWGQPVAYVPGQTFRNWLRYLSF